MIGELGDGAAREMNGTRLEDAAIVRRVLSDAAAVLDRLFRQALETARVRADAYSGDPGQTLEDAQRYIVERVKERPVTAALSGLGVGLLLGLLLSRRAR
jgi:ElaB/YqjD/DUF883 family membrane-anchored ribosome-binding protein